MFKPDIRSDAPLIAVVGEDYCFPYLVDLTVKKAIRGVSSLQFDVSDGNGSPLLAVHGKLWQPWTKQRIICDPFGLPVVTLRTKTLALRNVWRVFKGSSEKNLLYTVRETKYIQMKVELDVFMDGNQGDFCDFHVKGSYTSQNFKVFKRDTLIAEVKEVNKIDNFIKGKERFDVRVFPGADYVFIISLLVIINAINGGS